MVLLDEVISHDERRITCRASSHRDPSHPLARDGMLPVWAGIEYAAQAMAAHFSLSAGVTGAATIGLLGALRDVVCEASRLDDVDSPLIVEAESAYRELDATSANGIQYVRDHLCFPLAAGSFEDGMGA